MNKTRRTAQAKSGTSKDATDKLVKGIKRKTRKQYSAEESERANATGSRETANQDRSGGSAWRGKHCRPVSPRRERRTRKQSGRTVFPTNAESLYYTWSKEFLEAGKQRLAGDTARQATSPEVKELRSETTALKEIVADLTLENRLLKKA